MSSILNDVKHKIGPSGDYEYYDRDIIDAINSSFSSLNQLGVGPASGFSISDDSTEWEEFSDDAVILGFVRNYVYKKTRLIFDPPTNSFLITAIQEEIKELEWRLNVQVDPGEEVSA